MIWTPQADAFWRLSNAPDAWMAPEQFAAIWATHFHRAIARPSGAQAVGIGKEVADRIMSGERPIKKVEALAVAHFLLGLPAPGGCFADWFTARFGLAGPEVSAWLELPARRGVGRPVPGMNLEACLAGDPPNVALVRALDWLYRAGPLTPFEARP